MDEGEGQGARARRALGFRAVLDADAVIVLTECRSLVDDASTVLGGDVGVVEYTECPVLELIPKLTRNF